MDQAAAQAAPLSLANSVCKVPLFGSHLRAFEVILEVLRDVNLQGVLEVGTRHEHLQGDKHFWDEKGRAPLAILFQDVQANATQFVDVRVVDLRAEQTQRGHHRVLWWEVDLHFVFSTFIHSFGWPFKLYEQVQNVIVFDLRADPWRRIIEKLCHFLRNSRYVWVRPIRTWFSLHCFLIIKSLKATSYL